MLRRALPSWLYPLVAIVSAASTLGGAPKAAEAVTVRLDFSGFVEDIGGDTGGDVVIGTQFTATVIYDDAAPSNAPQPIIDGFASYNQVSAPPAGMSATIGPWSVSVGPFDPDAPGDGTGFDFNLFDRSGSPASSQDFVVWNTTVTSVDGLDTPIVPGGSVTGFCCSALSIGLGGPAGTLQSFSFADLPLDLASWTERHLSLSLALDLEGEDWIEVSASIASLTVTTIPEPGTAALVALGLLALPRLRDRARR